MDSLALQKLLSEQILEPVAPILLAAPGCLAGFPAGIKVIEIVGAVLFPYPFCLGFFALIMCIRGIMPAVAAAPKIGVTIGATIAHAKPAIDFVGSSTAIAAEGRFFTHHDSCFPWALPIELSPGPAFVGRPGIHKLHPQSAPI